MVTLSFEEKYNAIGKKESTYEGMFITAVTSTNIFCRPSCRAKKPKAENVLFFETAQQALQNGFRPCKICRPMEPEGNMPNYLKSVVDELENRPFFKIKDNDLRARGIEPSQVRRWFKKNHGMTFHSFQRMLRINYAYNELKCGRSVTSTAFDAGFESLSGFTECFQNIFGRSASMAPVKNVINIVRFATKLGPMYACATVDGLCLLEFTDRRMLETEFEDLCKRLDAVILPGKNYYLRQTQIEVTEYFDGRRTEFTVPLLTPGTRFQQTVWNVLKTIPYGKTWTYRQQAAVIGKPDSIRAVASANGYNRVALIIPCHRVIGSNGNLKGYGGGFERKKWLLEFEKMKLLSGNHDSKAI